ncbi:hypothetical protein SAMN05421823_101248 [Catalinimonas alkaloidigena]|uniref:Uncharacterized protein n=1 Tax=Catalinimonas alkaloidigena TaxID=1075417 RepID=A0A1G8X2P4_9BACT|nr:hypothetical protein [Catalinimonas alkaloidigena]SDJ84793.1 hypothetical protein SAMN05421823_101248 [Catalinimonas alkaloidigena]
MTLYERYLHGETRQVYDEILDLGENAFESDTLAYMDRVFSEMFRRVAHNLKVIRQKLAHLGYQLHRERAATYERPLVEPFPATESLLQTLDEAVRPYGYVPRSLHHFYRAVGGVNLAWDYQRFPTLLWERTDPVQIASLDALVEEVTDDYWEASTREAVAMEERACLELAADVYHKDNVSGGSAYALEITSMPSMDSFFRHEPHETTFVNYLRLSFKACGFPGMQGRQDETYQRFCQKVRPQLLEI